MGNPHPDLVAAVRAGGAVSCVSALRLRGAWTIDDGALHIRMRRGTTPTAGRGLRRHWGDRPVLEPMDLARDGARCVARCLPFEQAVVAIDSALHLGLITLAELREGADVRMLRLIGLLDPRSESGLESLARVRLRRLRVRVRPQVRIPGVGRVDLLIGDRLILELDGEGFHDFERDRSRDRRAAVLKYLTVRASYRQVMNDWAALEAELLVLIRRRDHLRRMQRGRGTRNRSVEARVLPRSPIRVARPQVP